MSRQPQTTPVVGIGASAGGIEALEGFFRGLPADPGLGIVVVTHLSPERESLLHEIIPRYTSLRVSVATDNAEVHADTVYVLPSDAILSLEGGRLRIRTQPHGRRERKPIDIFFSSLAIDRGERAAGIVLSGGDSDGTLGVKAIKERGGLTLAQVGDGFGPQHPDMPESAIATGLVDFAIPVDRMGEKLVEFVRGLEVFDRLAATPDDAVGAAELADEARAEIYTILRNQLGHDFSGYKPKTFLRRVRRRMQVAQLSTLDAYIEHLRREPREVTALFRDLLINVTSFFRDVDAFESLSRDVIPKLVEGKNADDVVRIWVPGCATGEEVFSLGMLVREELDGLPSAPRVQIFATDIDERALGIARAARYPAALLDSVSDERRRRFFVADGGSFVVSKDVRDLCIFSPHSVIRDPPFARIDLVSCRNLLIYFGSDVQNQVIPVFHYALKPGGYLFLGTAENISQFADLFVAMDKRNRIFVRRLNGPTVRLPLLLNSLKGSKAVAFLPRLSPLGGVALRQAVDEQVLEHFSPPHVVVNAESDVVYFSARTGKYLEPAAGIPTRQLMTMARKGLRLDLRNVFREVVETGRAVIRDGVAVEVDEGRVQMLRLIAEPLIDRSRTDALYLILFHDDGPMLSRDDALGRVSVTPDGTSAHLERELRELREQLQAIIEEYETALEELKSSNEELVSVNEELQSTNEELEASKEELQSVNEELNTVNMELNGKVEALDHANNDLKNLFDSTDIATIFLNRQLVIRNYTPAVSEIFNILPGDRGRPITDLSSRFDLLTLVDDFGRALHEGHRTERRISLANGAPHYLVRVVPYRDGSHLIDGVVVTFVNITSLIQAEIQSVLIAELQHRTRNLLAIVQSIALQTLGKSGAMEAFAARLSALGRVQGLVSLAEIGEVDLGDVIRQELHAVSGAGPEKIAISGPPVRLSMELVQTFALVLHELATNAVKYGALQEGPGQLDVRWRVESAEGHSAVLFFEWHERGVRMPDPDPDRRGYGRDLIERSLGFTLRARSTFSLGPDGVVCQVELPLRTASGP